ncbi:GNAT family N-acetyltransferase [Fodinicola acaciae]|uniref:GNAT family N-acetyltransferase n=1 Tax=Fodinicola acaciae TaxID=2681555 RepID=UPI0013D59C90|nr:GNAT family N-acetyltransferase [Fodinicola acaciae]
MPADLDVRVLTADELPAAYELGRVAFGLAAEPPQRVLEERPGLTRWGAFLGGRLVGKAIDLHHDQWWAGRKVPAADIGGVAVVPETRGRGVARSVLTALLARARDRGAAVSALYPSVSAAYRSCGWEIVGALPHRELPVNAIPRLAPAEKLTVRPGGVEDLPAMAALYQQVARNRCGMLTREGILFGTDAGGLTAKVDGLSLVEEENRLVGYMSWQRGEGWGPDAALTVTDLLALTPDAARELLAVLASWRSVVGAIRLHTLILEPLLSVLPLENTRELKPEPWMLRPVDVVAAVERRGWPAYVRGAVEFYLEDRLAPWNAGAWRLEIADGRGRLERTDGTPGLRLAVGGFALLYAGAARAHALVEAGLLRCDENADPSTVDILGSGEQAQLLDHF